MRSWFVHLLLGLSLVIIFALFSFLVDINVFKQLDFDATVRLQDNISRRFDDFFSWFSVIGMFEITTIILLFILIIKRKILAGSMTFFLFGLFHIIEIFGKSIVENTPPPEFMLRTKRFIEFPQFHVRSEYSYPSGHSGRTVFISVLIILFVWNIKRIPVIYRLVIITIVGMFDLCMLFSRVYLGEHWLTDIVGGSILGAAFALLGASLYGLSENTRKTKK